MRDELQSIRNTELGALKVTPVSLTTTGRVDIRCSLSTSGFSQAQEQHLMEEVATEQKRVQDLQNQLRALKEALESINKMVGKVHSMWGCALRL